MVGNAPQVNRAVGSHLSFAGGKKYSKKYGKKSNGHKQNYGCPICMNMRKKKGGDMDNEAVEDKVEDKIQDTTDEFVDGNDYGEETADSEIVTSSQNAGKRKTKKYGGKSRRHKRTKRRTRKHKKYTRRY